MRPHYFPKIQVILLQSHSVLYKGCSAPRVRHTAIKAHGPVEWRRNRCDWLAISREFLLRAISMAGSSITCRPRRSREATSLRRAQLQFRPTAPRQTDGGVSRPAPGVSSELEPAAGVCIVRLTITPRRIIRKCLT